MLRSSENWESVPGNFDTLNVSELFPSSNKYGIPDMLPCEEIPEELVPYGTQVRRSYAQAKEKFIHFFLDDYQFESLWNKPNKTLQPIVNIGYAFSPDFSVFVGYPRALQIYNVYRNRWLGRFWQSHDVEVIPTISWGDRDTYDFCFLGVPKNSVVAISTVGINSREKKEVFKQGFEEMIRQLEPKLVLVYGETKPLEFEEYCNVKYYPSFWKVRRRQMKEKANENSGQEQIQEN